MFASSSLMVVDNLNILIDVHFDTLSVTWKFVLILHCKQLVQLFKFLL